MANPKTLKSTLLLTCLIILLQCSKIHCHSGHEDGGDEEGEDLHSKSLILVKIWCVIIMFVIVFAGGVSPYFFRWNESFLLLGLQFAAGVFMGTALMHFLSDSNETFQDLSTKEYPFAFMLAASGYLLTMFADCVIVTVMNRGAQKQSNSKVENELEDGVGVGVGGIRETAADFHHHHGLTVTAASWSDSILLILALCFHSVFEGIAVGVADTKSDAWRNLWTISLHKIFAAIGMGIALLKMIPKRPLLLTCAYSFAFGISSPIGIGIGIAINATTQGRTADWVYAISMGIACGVFVYVAINHLMAKGFKPSTPNRFDTPFYKFLAVLLGVAVIAVVMIWD